MFVRDTAAGYTTNRGSAREASVTAPLHDFSRLMAFSETAPVSLGKRKKEQEWPDRAAKRRKTSFTCQTYVSVDPGEEVTVIVSAPYPPIAVFSHPVI